MASVALTAQSRGMIPVLWDIGQDISRNPPFTVSPELTFALKQIQAPKDASNGQ